MEDKDKKGLFGKISDKWSETREKISNKFLSAKEVIKAKFKQSKTKIVVSVGSLVLVATVALTVACSSGANKPDIDNDNDIQYETTIDGEVIEVIKPNNGNTQNENISTNSLESYVLNNPEYRDLFAETAHLSNQNNQNYYQLAPHPYAFLEEKGHNVQGIKNGTVECETMTYTLEGDKDSVFMAVKVYENNIATHYHTEYELNKKDLEFYNKVRSGYYIQNVVINDAISELYKPVKETCVKLPESSSKGLDDTLNCRYALKSDYSRLIITGVGSDRETFDVIALPKFNLVSPSGATSKVRSATLKVTGLIKNNDGVFSLPHSSDFIHSTVTYEDHAAHVYDVQEYAWSIKNDLNK